MDDENVSLVDAVRRCNDAMKAFADVIAHGTEFDRFCEGEDGIKRRGIPYTKYWLEWANGRTDPGWGFALEFGYVPPDPCYTRTRYLILRVKMLYWWYEITVNWRY